MEHVWQCIEVGNTYSEYECTVCKRRIVEDMEDAGTLPLEGCEGPQQQIEIDCKEEDGKYL